MRRGITATALVAALVMTASACGGDDDGRNGADGGSGALSGTVVLQPELVVRGSTVRRSG